MGEKTILIVDDEPSMRMALSESLVSCGYRVDTAVDGADGLSKFRYGRYEAVITDMRMPKVNGMDVLRGVKASSPQTHVIVITAYGTVSTAVEAMKNGASDFIMKPFSLDELEGVVKNVLADGIPEDNAPYRRREQERQREIVARDEKMLSLLEMLKCVARSKASILIQGESGTGKELIARHIHRHSNRAGMPFVAVNCAAVPYNLLESEMFGYEKGAFTGAAQRKIGKFEMADGGTLLLDEVSELDIHLQAKLLRAIQESEIDRLGGKDPVRVNVRIIATTNLDPKKCVAEKIQGRPLLSPERHPGESTSPQGEKGGHPLPRIPFSREVQRRPGKGKTGGFSGGLRIAACPSLAGEREGAGKRDGTGRPHLRRRADQAGASAYRRGRGRGKTGRGSVG